MIIHPLFVTKGFDILCMLRPTALIPTPGDDPYLRINAIKLLEDAIYKTIRSSMETVNSEDAVEVTMTKNQYHFFSQ